MNSDAPEPEKVPPQAEESQNSYYQHLLKKCRSRRALQRATDPTRPVGSEDK